MMKVIQEFESPLLLQEALALGRLSSWTETLVVVGSVNLGGA